MSTCPVCGVTVPRSRLEFHVNICLDRNSAPPPSAIASTGGPILTSTRLSSPLPAPEVRTLLPELRLLRLQNAAVSSSNPPQGGLLYFKLNTIEKRSGSSLQTLEPFPPSYTAKISLDGHSFTSPTIASRRLPTSNSLLAHMAFEGVIEIHEYLSSAQVSIEVSEQNTLAIGYDAKVLGSVKIRLSEALSLHAQSSLTESERRKTWKKIIPMGGWQTGTYSPVISSQSSSPVSSPKKKKRKDEEQRDRDRSSSSSPLSIISHLSTRTPASFSILPLTTQPIPLLPSLPHGRFTSFDDPSLWMKLASSSKDSPLAVSFSDLPVGGWLGVKSHKLLIRVPHKKIAQEAKERMPRERSFWQRISLCLFGEVEDDGVHDSESAIVIEDERIRARRQSIRNVLAGVTTALQFNSKNSSTTSSSEDESFKWGMVEKTTANKKKSLANLSSPVSASPPPPPPPPPPPQDIVEVSIQLIYIPTADILRVPGSSPHITPAHRAAIDGNAVLLRALASSKREVLLQRTTPVECLTTLNNESVFSLSHLSVLDVAILARQQHIVSLLCAALLPSPRLGGGDSLGLHALHIAAFSGDSSILQAVVSSITQGAAEAAKADLVASSVRARLGNVSDSTRDQILHSSSSSVRGLGLGSGGIIQPRQSDVEDVENLVSAWTASVKHSRVKKCLKSTCDDFQEQISTSNQLRNFLEPLSLAHSSIPEVQSSTSSYSSSSSSNAATSTASGTVFEKARQLKVLSVKRFESGTETGILDLASGIDGITPLGFCALRGDAEGALVLLRAGAHPGLTESRYQRTILMMALRGGSSSAFTRVAALILLRNESLLPVSNFIRLSPPPPPSSSSSSSLSSLELPTLGCCRGVVLNHSSSSTSVSQSSDSILLRTPLLTTKLSFSFGSDSEGQIEDKSYLTGKQVREKMAHCRPAAVSRQGETALLLATINACNASCECCSDSEKTASNVGPSVGQSSSIISSLAVVRLLIEAGCSRSVPSLALIESSSTSEPFPCGTTSLHVAARNLHLCSVRLLTLTDSNSVFALLMSLRDREDSVQPVWDIPTFQNDAEVVSFCNALAERDERDWRGVNLPKRIDLPVTSMFASTSEELEITNCEALCESVSIIRALVPQEPSSFSSSMGDDGRGSGRRTNRFSHRTITSVRDSSGRTPLGIAALAAAADPSRLSSIIVLRLLFKLRTLEIWSREQEFSKDRFNQVGNEFDEGQELEIDLS